MPSNAAAPKLSDIPRKTPTQVLSKYSSRHGGLQLYQNSPRRPRPLPRKHPKTKEHPLSRTTSTDHVLLLPSLLSSPTIITIVTMILTFSLYC